MLPTTLYYERSTDRFVSHPPDNPCLSSNSQYCLQDFLLFLNSLDHNLRNKNSTEERIIYPSSNDTHPEMVFTKSLGMTILFVLFLLSGLWIILPCLCYLFCVPLADEDNR